MIDITYNQMLTSMVNKPSMATVYRELSLSEKSSSFFFRKLSVGALATIAINFSAILDFYRWLRQLFSYGVSV